MNECKTVTSPSVLRITFSFRVTHLTMDDEGNILKRKQRKTIEKCKISSVDTKSVSVVF